MSDEAAGDFSYRITAHPHVEGGPDAPFFSPADLLSARWDGPDMTGALVEFESVPGGFSLSWYRCDCPWWHRLPLAGRFVHRLVRPELP